MNIVERDVLIFLKDLYGEDAVSFIDGKIYVDDNDTGRGYVCEITETT